MAKKPLPKFIEPMMASVVIALVSEHASEAHRCARFSPG
jgi:hypothetical protein